MRRGARRTIAAGATAIATMFFFGTSMRSSDGIREDARQSSCLVALAAGDVQGLDLGASCAFLGIPYAASTGGENRWKPPQPPLPWAPALLNAITPPLGCPSIAVFGTIGSISGNENCLMLNVWVSDPPAADPAPVIVWLHTGAFIGASANFAGTNGRRLSEETGVIVVAPNYRLGAFGFLAHPALAAESPSASTGNYGLLDQQAALRWVRDNIAQFGGDPQNVTIAGTSAGGQSVGLQLVAPGSKDLFARAIIQSAYPTSRWRDEAEAAVQGIAFATALGCTNPATVLACMRSASRDSVLTALPQATQQIVEPPGRTFWEPVVDGVVIPDQPRNLFTRGRFHRVPTIVGFNRDEGWGAFVTRSFPSGVSVEQYEGWVMNEFGAHGPDVLERYPTSKFASPMEAIARVTGDAGFACEARRLARLIGRPRTPSYLYSYEYEIDTLAVDHVIHGVESNILFGNNYAPPIFPAYTLNDADLELHASMSEYWTRFAATGNPNPPGTAAPRWTAFRHPIGKKQSDQYLVFDAVIERRKWERESPCDFFDQFFFRSLLSGVPASAQ